MEKRKTTAKKKNLLYSYMRTRESSGETFLPSEKVDTRRIRIYYVPATEHSTDITAVVVLVGIAVDKIRTFT